MMGMSRAFIFTKSSDLPLYYYYYYYYYYFHMYNYAVINNLVEDGYREVSGYYRGFDPGDA
jgi:hypothetical protein